VVRFEKDRLIIEVDTRGEMSSQVYYDLLDALNEIIWYALQNDEENLIRFEVGTLVYYLQAALIGYTAHRKERPDPADD
jgi:hypothetical protein